MSVFKMAWRNVWRNPRRTLVTVGAMSLALFIMILYSGLVEGYLEGMERNILDLEMGDMQIFAGDYRDNPSIYTRIENPDTLVASLDEAGYPACARLLGAGLAAAGDTSAGVIFRGVNVEQDARVSRVYEQIKEGKWLDPADPHGVVVGRRVARNLDVKPGDELVVLTQGADGSMANDLYTVRGILKGISDPVDRAGIYMTATAFRELLVLSEGAHQIVVRRPPGVLLPAALANVESLAPDLDVKTWRQLMPTLSSLLESTRGLMVMMFLIVYIAIGMVILNAMLMAVFERVREFGVLKAVGMGPGGVFRLILTESIIQTGLAMIVGGTLSLPSIWYLSKYGIDTGKMAGISIFGIAWDPIWRASVNTNTFLGPVVTLVFIVSIAVLYPAIKAALIRPVEAMHHR